MTDSGLDEFLALHPEYSVLGTIGRGGMSTVYLAEQLRLERRVAIKLMDGSLADDQRARERFLRGHAQWLRSTTLVCFPSMTQVKPDRPSSPSCDMSTDPICASFSVPMGHNRWSRSHT